MKDLYLIGGGGHCASCIDVIESEGKFQIKGIFDLAENIGKNLLGHPIIDTDENLAQYINSQTFFLITVGQIKSASIRKKIAEKLKKLQANQATVISPRAYVSKHATLGSGTIVLHDALVNANVRVGEHCIINTKSLLEHDSTIGDFSHISTASVVNGNCKIGDEVFIGSNSVLKEGAVISSQQIVPAGSFFRG